MAGRYRCTRCGKDENEARKGCDRAPCPMALADGATATAQTGELLPCPFCGGEAEMDTQQGYRILATGEIDNAIAIYCTSCDAGMQMCRADVPDAEPEWVAEAWNRRAFATSLRPAAQPGVTAEQVERAAFEAWAKDEFPNSVPSQAVWTGWMGRASLPASGQGAPVVGSHGGWTRTSTPPKSGGPLIVGGYIKDGSMPRRFERAWGYVILTLDGPEWSITEKGKEHVPMEWWCETLSHPEREDHPTPPVAGAVPDEVRARAYSDLHALMSEGLSRGHDESHGYTLGGDRAYLVDADLFDMLEASLKLLLAQPQAGSQPGAEREAGKARETRQWFCGHCGDFKAAFVKQCFCGTDKPGNGWEDEIDDEGEPLPAPPGAEREAGKPCKWGGGNDYMACRTCGLEYDYRSQDRPPCPRASPSPSAPGGWEPIGTALPDPNRWLWVYAPGAEFGLPDIVCPCRWHPDAGFCVDELRHPTHWIAMNVPAPPASAGSEG